MPNNPQSASVVTPPWLAKLNSLNEQVDSAISHTQPNPMQSPSQVAATQTQIDTPIQIEIDQAGIDAFNTVLPTLVEVPPTQVEPVTQTNVVKGAAIQFDAVQFAQTIGRGSRGDSDAEAVSGHGLYYGVNAEASGPWEQASLIKEDALLSNDEIPGMPSNWKPPVEVELPEVGDAGAPLVQPAAEVVEYESADTNQPRVSEEEYYAAIVALIGQSNPDEAKLIGRLRLFQSQFVGLITSPEQAIDHIAQCRASNIPVGGSEAVGLSPQSVSLKHKQYIDRRYAPHRAKKAAVESARQDWKKAIADREAAILQWDTFVKWHHDNYNRLKAMEPDAFVTKEVK